MMPDADPAAASAPDHSPLAGVRVVDLSRLLPGPLCVRILADLGADVLKVEEPRLGDPVRQAPPGRQGQGALAALLLAGLRSIALDLKQPDARDVLLTLLAEADVLVETFRPGTLARLGLAPAELRRWFPRLIVTSLSGWGQAGPAAGRAGHDLTYQALAGTLAPTATMPALPVADLIGGWSTATAVLAALHARGRTGQGTWIDAALYDAALHANLTGWVGEVDGRKRVGEALPLSGALPCYGLYASADGQLLALAALERHFWRRFCDVAGCPRLRRRPYDRAPAVRAAVAAVIARRTRSEWETLAAAHDLPLEPVLTAAEALAHPHARVRDVVRHDSSGLPRLAFPARFDGRRLATGMTVPGLGDATAALVASGRFHRRRGIGRRRSFERFLTGLFLLR